jgi:hypothetical protein
MKQVEILTRSHLARLALPQTGARRRLSMTPEGERLPE